MNGDPTTGENLNLVDLIDLLIAPAAPERISMAPQTVGWLVLAIALIVVLGLLIWRIAARRRADSYRRIALARLAGVGNDPVAIAEILRRTALVAFPREKVASLSGRDWLDFLDRTGGGSEFLETAGKALAEAPYRPDPAPSDRLAAMAERWVRRHRQETGS